MSVVSNAKDGRIRVVIADDDLSILKHLHQFLEPAFEVVGKACNGRELLEVVDCHRPAIVVADITMPEINGIEAARSITGRYPQVKVVILSVHSACEIVDAAFAAGASGYVVKLRASTDLIPAMTSVLDGGTFRP
jgi:DNA-binding NarL/FixJ family response regulator